jgi:hypothetical protein
MPPDIPVAHPVLLHVARFNPRRLVMFGTTKEKGKGATAGRNVKTMSIWLCTIAVFAMLFSTGPAWADDDNTEEGLFTAVAPDAMIVLDLSGSMKWTPPGGPRFVEQRDESLQQRHLLGALL